MKISVLTACRNAEATIARTISSFLSQDHADKEMIILDGASRDDTLAIAESFRSPLIRIMSAADSGMYDALNRGLEVYGGDAVGVLNADDTFRDARVLTRVDEALAHHDAAHGHLDFHDARGRVVRKWRARPRPSSGFASGWMPAHPTFYVTRRVASAVGPFDLSLPTAADYEWMMRAVDVMGCSTAMIPHVLVDMSIGGRSTSSIWSHLVHNYEALRARRKWLKSGLIDWALIAKPASKLRQFARARQEGA